MNTMVRPDYNQYNRERDTFRGDNIEIILNDRVTGLELLDCMLGDIVAVGSTRRIFNHRFDKNLVIKIETGNANANVLECETWQHVEYVKSISPWFAKCHFISKCGRILIQEKVKANSNVFDKRPNKLPSFFTDTKWENFGYRGKQLVCLDYANNLLREEGMKVKMVKVEW